MPNDHVRSHSNSPPLPPPKPKRRRRATTTTMSMRTGGDEDDIINDSIDDSNNTVNEDGDIMVPPVPRRRHSRRPQLRRQMRSHRVSKLEDRCRAGRRINGGVGYTASGRPPGSPSIGQSRTSSTFYQQLVSGGMWPTLQGRHGKLVRRLPHQGAAYHFKLA